MPPGDAAVAGARTGSPPADLSDVDVVVSLGGDGTVLRAVALVAGAGVPVLAVNVGALGYLTEVEPADLSPALDRFISGDYVVEERMMLDVSVELDGRTPSLHCALNELVVEKEEPGHTIRLLPSINGVPFTPYAADGLIVATPTGSTAYNLSVRGPILSPRVRALVMTPVSPHMLFDRALVLADDEEVMIELKGHRRASLAVDGQTIGSLQGGDRVRCRAAEQHACFVRFGRRDFHQLLKAKFQLADR